MNTFMAVGRIGHDVEVRQAGSTSVAVFNIAVDVGFGDRKQTDWYRCQLWGKRAEGGLIQYLVKGAQVAVSGELKQNKYTANDGMEKTSMDINVNDVALVGGQQHDNGFQQAPQQQASGTGGQQFQQQAPQQQSVSETSPAGQNFAGDIPFANPYKHKEYLI